MDNGGKAQSILLSWQADTLGWSASIYSNDGQGLPYYTINRQLRGIGDTSGIVFKTQPHSQLNTQ